MTAIDETADVVEEVTELAGGSRGLGLAFGALLLGAGIGGGLGYILATRRLAAKYARIADDEIDEMREHYRAKGVALEAQAGKTDLAEMVAERGYSSPEPDVSASPPMAVQPPKNVAEVEDDSEMAEDEVEGPNGVKAKGEVAVRNIFREREQSVPHDWDRHTELRRRTPDRPYVIHVDEKGDMEGYSDVSYTYYAADDVLCNEKDEVIDPEMRDDLIGEANLERFGHGSGDSTIVFIRNDNLEILFEIIKSPNSYAEEVHGFSHESFDRGNLERMRRRERDEE